MVIDNSVDKNVYDMFSGVRLPEMRAGLTAPTGAAEPWASLPVGSFYMQSVSATVHRWYQKLNDNKRDDDWSMGMHCLQQRILFSQFTDGGGASGTLALTEKIPQGAWVLRAVLQNVTGFAGNTSAVITVGDGSDVDRYNTGTPSVFTTANAIDLGAPSGVQIHTAEATVTVTVTGATDFTAVNAGAATVRIYYML